MNLSEKLQIKPGKHWLFFNAPANYLTIIEPLPDEVMQLIDACIEIPQFGTKHSFNIVVSAGIVLWDFYSKMVIL